MNAAHLLDRAGAEYNILSVVTAQSAKRAESIYNFFKSIALSGSSSFLALNL